MITGTKYKDNFFTFRIDKKDFKKKMDTIQNEFMMNSYTEVLKRLVNEKYKRIIKSKNGKPKPIYPYAKLYPRVKEKIYS